MRCAAREKRARPITSSIWDSALNVGETYVLDLDDIGAAVTVNAVDADARTLNVSVEFVARSSAERTRTRDDRVIPDIMLQRSATRRRVADRPIQHARDEPID